MGPLISAKQRDRVLGYIEKGKDEGRAVVVGGGRPAHLDKGWFVEPTLFADVDNYDDHRPRGDLRTGAHRHPVRGRRRRGAPRQRQPVRPRRLRDVGFRGPRDGGRPRGCAPAPSASTVASPTAPTRRSAATRRAASGARTGSRASCSTPRSRPSPSASQRTDRSVAEGAEQDDEGEERQVRVEHEQHAPQESSAMPRGQRRTTGPEPLTGATNGVDRTRLAIRL